MNDVMKNSNFDNFYFSRPAIQFWPWPVCKSIQLIMLLLIVACHSPYENFDGQVATVTQADTTFASPLDSLEWVIFNGTDEQKRDAALQLDNYRVSNPSKVLELMRNLYYKYEKSDDMILLGHITSTIGGVYFESGMIDSALIYFNQTASFYEKSNEEEYLAKSRIRLAHTQRLALDFDKAIENSLKALDYFQENFQPNRILNIYNHISLVYEAMGNLNKQEEYLLKALELSKHEEVNKESTGTTLINLAILKANKKNYDEAVMFGTQSIEMFREAGKGSEKLLGLALQRLVFVLFVADKTENIKAYLDEAFAIAEQIQNQPLKKDVLLARVRYHVEINEDYQAAYNDAKIAEELMDTTDLANVDFLYYQLTYAAIGIGNREEGFKYLSKYSTATRNKQNNLLAEKTSEMEVRHETAKKELEIERQKGVIARHNMQRGLLVGGVVFCVVLLALLWYMLRLRNRRNIALTERSVALTERNVALTDRNDALTERADILSEMNVTKDKFFNIISHDLRNPASALHDNLRLLVRNIRLWDADMLSDFSNELLHSAEGQVELLNDLLNWARLQTGRITCTPVVFDLTTCLRTDIALVRKLAENKGVALQCQMPDDAAVTCDANMLTTVVRNLLTNAVKFTAPGGTVTLSITAETSDTDSSDPAILNSPFSILHSLNYTVSITDTGTGMTPEQIENLFRLDKPQTRRGTVGEEGSGLGLIVCKELLAKHDSVLHIESHEGKGSRFWFSVMSGG